MGCCVCARLQVGWLVMLWVGDLLDCLWMLIVLLVYGCLLIAIGFVGVRIFVGVCFGV